MQPTMTVNKIVTKIEANPLLVDRENEYKQLRVAAYCRVSTDSDEQLESYEAQLAYYTDAIAKNPKWRFAGIYADEGITGTQASKRPQFQKMIKDCEKGKVDLILTKSVARFARNTVDSLKYVRKLRAMGIGVYFEEQSLDSMKSENEMFLGLYSVMAQAESENISANVRWGIQQRMKSGTFAFRYNILGYRKGENGEPEIVPDEAEVVRKIFQMYLDGNSLDQIKAYLESNGIRTKQGKHIWSKQIIQGILCNERYTGDMLLQKTYIENCISKKSKKNRGEMAKYLITNNHSAIISKELFKSVQAEMARRSSKRKTSDLSITEQGKYSGKYALTEILVCGECGSPYRRKTWMIKGEKKRVWRCLNRVEHGTVYCKKSVSIDEEKLHEAICRGLRNAFAYREEESDLILSGLSYAVTGDDNILDAYVIEQKIRELKQDMEDMIMMSMRTEGDAEKFEIEIRKISDQLCAMREQLDIARKQMSASEKVNTEIENIRSFLADTEINFAEYNEIVVSFAEIVYIAKYLCQLLYHGKILLCGQELFCSYYYSTTLWADFPLFFDFFRRTHVIYSFSVDNCFEIWYHKENWEC